MKEQLNFWIKLSDLEKNAEFIKNYYKTNGINEDLQSDNKQFSRNNISCKTKAYMNTREKHAKTIVKKASANISEPMLLYRLLRFASLENQKREVHLLSALQVTVLHFQSSFIVSYSQHFFLAIGRKIRPH